jgi:hypothetical protein
MAKNHIFDEVLGQGSRFCLLRERMISCRGPLSGRKVSALAGLGPATGHEGLAKLVQQGLVSQTSKGTTFLFTLNRENSLAKSCLCPLFEYERNQEIGLTQGFSTPEPAMRPNYPPVTEPVPNPAEESKAPTPAPQAPETNKLPVNGTRVIADVLKNELKKSIGKFLGF